MPSLAHAACLVAALCFAPGCAKSGPTPEEQKAEDERRERELAEEIARAHAPYQRAVEAFFGATSAGDYDAAYGMLAPSYTNMIEKNSFVERAKANKNFAKKVEVKILHTRAQAGTTRARCILGELGLAEIDFSTASGSPKISSLALGGMQALPSPP